MCFDIGQNSFNILKWKYHKCQRSFFKYLRDSLKCEEKARELIGDADWMTALPLYGHTQHRYHNQAPGPEK